MGFKVGDKYRENPLSIKPGGVTIVVQYKNGKVYEYDKIKNPEAYFRKLQKLRKSREIVDAWIKNSRLRDF